MEYTQMTIDDWISIKEGLKQDLIGVQESFVKIGYTLRRIEEQELYRNDGHKNITEFAQKEYGLGASTVSRFIAINKKYSIDGYSEKLRPEFARLGSSKLAEMLALPEEDMEMIQPEATREGIRELKQFNKAPQEGVDDVKDLVKGFFEANLETLEELYKSEAFETGEMNRLIDTVNPSGNRTFKKGLFFLIMYEQDIKIKKFGANPKVMQWEEFFAITREIYGEDLEQIEVLKKQKEFKTQEAEVEEQANEEKGEEKEKEIKEKEIAPAQEIQEIQSVPPVLVEEKTLEKISIHTEGVTIEQTKNDEQRYDEEREEIDEETAEKIEVQQEDDEKMSNREMCKKALHEYIDSLDDNGMFNFIIDQEITGTYVYDCEACEKEHCCGGRRVDICRKRFKDWLNK